LVELLHLLLRLDLPEEPRLFFPALEALDVEALAVVDKLAGGRAFQGRRVVIVVLGGLATLLMTG
jgi:hypothetical protein